jgi:WD40 repeat protein
MSSVDVSYDGSMVVAGTLNFITSSTYDGKVKFWSVAGGSTPVWTYAGMGDEVAGVQFSKNGRFLCAGSWGNYYNPSVLNLLVFKTTHPVNVPWYAANSQGSFFAASVSDDGQTVIGTGKAVHARAFGSGGMLFNLFIDTTENIIGVHNNHGSIPDNYSLSQNYPNPFNPSTTIDYQLPVSGFVKISVFDVLGQEVKTLVNEYKQAGSYNVRFDASELPSGVYFYKITSNDFTSTKKLTLIK